MRRKIKSKLNSIVIALLSITIPTISVISLAGCDNDKPKTYDNEVEQRIMEIATADIDKEDLGWFADGTYYPVGNVTPEWEKVAYLHKDGNYLEVQIEGIAGNGQSNVENSTLHRGFMMLSVDREYEATKTYKISLVDVGNRDKHNYLGAVPWEAWDGPNGVVDENTEGFEEDSPMMKWHTLAPKSYKDIIKLAKEGKITDSDIHISNDVCTIKYVGTGCILLNDAWYKAEGFEPKPIKGYEGVLVDEYEDYELRGLLGREPNWDAIGDGETPEGYISLDEYNRIHGDEVVGDASESDGESNVGSNVENNGENGDGSETVENTNEDMSGTDEPFTEPEQVSEGSIDDVNIVEPIENDTAEQLEKAWEEWYESLTPHEQYLVTPEVYWDEPYDPRDEAEYDEDIENVSGDGTIENGEEPVDTGEAPIDNGEVIGSGSDETVGEAIDPSEQVAYAQDNTEEPVEVPSDIQQ